MPVSNSANGFETTLTAPPGPTGLVFSVVSTTGSPTSPCYLVIDPYNSSAREVVYFDGVFTGTTLVTSDIANRYLEGSAASSGLNHAEGTLVLGALTKQLLDEIIAEINGKSDDDHDHDPSGATGIDEFYVKKDAGELDSYSEEIGDIVAAPSTYDIDTSARQHFSIALGNPTTTITFSNWHASRLVTITIRIKQDATGGRLVTWPSTIHWPGKSLPTLSTDADAVDVFMFRSWTSGSTIEGFVIGQNMGTA